MTDTLMILATLCGPLIAVQVTRYLDDLKEIRSRKLNIFKTLMATRAYSLSAAHVEALNRIDLEFNSNTKAEKKVLSIWKEYLDLLGNTSLSPEQWSFRRVDILVELLSAMGEALGYDFDKIQIKNATYAPVAHGRIEEEQQVIRGQVLEVLNGKRSLPIQVINSPQTTKSEADKNNKGSSWSTEEDSQLKAEFKNNISIAKIAEIHRRTRGAISSRLKKLGCFV